MPRLTHVFLASAMAAGLASGAVVTVINAPGTANAQGDFKVTPTQLQKNQRISQAAVRRGNMALNDLAPVRTAQSDAADNGTNGVRPLSQIPGSGDGWTTGQIADAAITGVKIGSEAVTDGKIGSGAVTSGKIGSEAVTGAKIATSAVTSAKVAGEAITTGKLASAAVTSPKIANLNVTREKLETDVQDNLPRTAAISAAGAVVRGRGAVSVSHAGGSGVYRVEFDRSITTCTWTATPAVDTSLAPGREITTAADSTDLTGKTIRVDIFDGDGTTGIDSGFHMHVVC